MNTVLAGDALGGQDGGDGVVKLCVNTVLSDTISLLYLTYEY